MTDSDYMKIVCERWLLENGDYDDLTVSWLGGKP